jgi:hypothetical protein
MYSKSTLFSECEVNVSLSNSFFFASTAVLVKVGYFG